MQHAGDRDHKVSDHPCLLCMGGEDSHQASSISVPKAYQLLTSPQIRCAKTGGEKISMAVSTPRVQDGARGIVCWKRGP